MGKNWGLIANLVESLTFARAEVVSKAREHQLHICMGERGYGNALLLSTMKK